MIKQKILNVFCFECNRTMMNVLHFSLYDNNDSFSFLSPVLVLFIVEHINIVFQRALCFALDTNKLSSNHVFGFD